MSHLTTFQSVRISATPSPSPLSNSAHVTPTVQTDALALQIITLEINSVQLYHKQIQFVWMELMEESPKNVEMAVLIMLIPAFQHATETAIVSQLANSKKVYVLTTVLAMDNVQMGAHVTDGAKILLHQSPTNAVKSGVTRPPAVKPTDEPFEILAMPNVQLTHTHNNAKIFVPHNTLQIYQIAHVILTVPTVAVAQQLMSLETAIAHLTVSSPTETVF